MFFFLLLIQKTKIFHIIGYCSFYDSIVELVFDNFSESAAAHGFFYGKPSKNARNKIQPSGVFQKKKFHFPYD